MGILDTYKRSPTVETPYSSATAEPNLPPRNRIYKGCSMLLSMGRLGKTDLLKGHRPKIAGNGCIAKNALEVIDQCSGEFAAKERSDSPGYSVSYTMRRAV